MNPFTAALIVVDLLNKGNQFLGAAQALASKIEAARAEKRDLTSAEVAPYLKKLDASIDHFEKMVPKKSLLSRKKK